MTYGPFCAKDQHLVWDRLCLFYLVTALSSLLILCLGGVLGGFEELGVSDTSIRPYLRNNDGSISLVIGIAFDSRSCRSADLGGSVPNHGHWFPVRIGDI